MAPFALRLPWTRGAKFSDSWSASDPAFAAWLFGNEDQSTEIVTPYSVLGLSAALRAVSVVATTIAGLPLKTYERDGDDKVRVPSDFDDPYPGVDGMTPFAWTETLLIHLQLWRKAFLWHEPRGDGSAGIAYRPIMPDHITKVYRDADGKRQFEYRDSTGGLKTVGSEQITFIPGPSIDGLDGHPMIYAARAIFSAAISGDKGAQATLRRGIRLGGLITPGDGEDDFEPEEANAILESLRARAMGRENAGDMAVINRRLKLQSWTPTNVDSQWIETKQAVLGDIERLFGVPPHLLADTEKQTSWGTGVQEQNLGLARYTLRGWSDRIEQVLAMRLPAEQFTEFDYKALLQGTPAEEVQLLIEQVKAGLLTENEARQIINKPPIEWAQGMSKEETDTLIAQVDAGLLTHEEARKQMGLEPINWPESLSKEESDALIAQVNAGILTQNEAREIMNRPPIDWPEVLTKDEIDSLIAQVKDGLMTLNEARAILKLPPIEWPDEPTGEEVTSLIEQVKAGLLTENEARVILGRPEIDWPEDLRPLVEQAQILINIGFDPADTLRVMGLPAIKHTGLPPVTVQKLADAEGIKVGKPEDAVPLPGDPVPVPGTAPAPVLTPSSNGATHE